MLHEHAVTSWPSPVAHLLWEPISGVGGRRPVSEKLDFCVSCVGQRRWASEQFLAQFGADDGYLFGRFARYPPMIRGRTQPVDLKDTDCVETFGSRVSF